MLFGNYASVDVLQQRLEEFAEEAAASDEPWRAIARDYLDGTGAFPDRIHVNLLYWVLLDRWARLRADWASWAGAIVATWPEAGGPADRQETLALLEAALGDDPDFLSSRPGFHRDRSPARRVNPSRPRPGSGPRVRARRRPDNA